ncbi:hypothetical protein K1719_032056 [Acacia pycnantha]|nr:hypothetical protein K1719_032056 [Acacia pycnantha]
MSTCITTVFLAGALFGGQGRKIPLDYPTRMKGISRGLAYLGIKVENCAYIRSLFIFLIGPHVLQEQENLIELVDPNLGSSYSSHEAMIMLEVPLLCYNPSPTLRPSMSSVVGMLEGKLPIQLRVGNQALAECRKMRDSMPLRYNQQESEIFNKKQEQTNTHLSPPSKLTSDHHHLPQGIRYPLVDTCHLTIVENPHTAICVLLQYKSAAQTREQCYYRAPYTPLQHKGVGRDDTPFFVRKFECLRFL